MLGVLAALSACTAAVAQARLPDPTRPPELTAEGQSAASTKRGHRLQSVLISPERKIAVIDGRTVPLGGRVDDALVVAITETGVTLRRGAQTELLPLQGPVQKKPVAP